MQRLIPAAVELRLPQRREQLAGDGLQRLDFRGRHIATADDDLYPHAAPPIGAGE